MHKISDGFIHLIVRWIFLSKMLDVRKDASRAAPLHQSHPVCRFKIASLRGGKSDLKISDLISSFNNTKTTITRLGLQCQTPVW